MIDLSRAAWRKSSRSNGSSQCVEVAANLPGVAAIRDSKDPNGPTLVFTPAAWSTFTASIRAGHLDA